MMQFFRPLYFMAQDIHDELGTDVYNLTLSLFPVEISKIIS
jgi:hypothetical protein